MWGAAGRVIDNVKHISGLTLKLPKTWIVPVFEVCNNEKIKHIRAWLEATLPQWGGVNIAGCARHLGDFLGPAAKGSSWARPISKLRSGVDQVVKSGLSGTGAVFHYNH